LNLSTENMGMSWENNGDLYIYPVILGYLIRISNEDMGTYGNIIGKMMKIWDIHWDEQW
jgi:hypothetical protein